MDETIQEFRARMRRVIDGLEADDDPNDPCRLTPEHWLKMAALDLRRFDPVPDRRG